MDRLIISSILRKLPLKLLLILLALFGVFMFCFSSAESVNDLIDIISDGTYSLTDDYQILTDFIADGKTYCLRVNSYSSWNSVSPIKFGISSSTSSLSNGNYLNIHSNQLPYIGCVSTNSNNSTRYLLIGKGDGLNVNVSFDYELFRLDSLLNTQLPVLTSLQCQEQYSLIPISSVDQTYCTTNNLCPSTDCPEYPDNPNLGTSNIYINDVFHPGAFNVIVNIPEEIDWDYAYTSSGSNFNLDIVGYNQDQEMIQGWIDTNNYKPTSEDFTNIFTNFSNFGGLLIGALFVILVFYFIKKLFK